MLMMTAKVDKKKILWVAVALIALILSGVLLLGGKEETAATGAPMVSSNDARVQFLKDFGWEITPSPAETGQVKFPEESSQIFDRYNNLQKSQGYDLSKYAGKKVMRYVYKVNNYPGATEPVYAPLLVYKPQLIGGDVPDPAAKGKISGFKMPENAATAPSTAPTTPTAVTQKIIVYKAFPWGKVDFVFCPEQGQNTKDG